MVEGKGNVFDRIKSGIQNISGSILRKTAPEFQERVMKAITDEEGNRRVVAVKGGQVTAFDKGNTEDMGPIKRNLPDPVTEAYDKQVMDKLGALAESLGIKHERVVAIPRKRAMGISLTGQNKVITEAATPEGVLLHEIGHQIDDKYDLQSKFVDQKVSDYKGLEKLQVGEMKRELRDLVDLKYETNPDVVKNFKSYVRKGPEKIAAMFEALVQAPDRFKEVAPNLYEKFTSFLASKPELAPILDIKRSMEITQNKVGEVNRPGIFTDKNGKDWQLGQATVKEIEANTDLKYYKDPIVQVLDSYLRLRRVERAVDFLDSVKDDPDFEKVAMRYDGGQAIPEGWKPTQLAQFRGYALDPKVADVMNSFQKEMLDQKDPFNLLMGINRFVRVNMFLNPLVHPANVGTSWATNLLCKSYLSSI